MIPPLPAQLLELLGLLLEVELAQHLLKMHLPGHMLTTCEILLKK